MIHDWLIRVRAIFGRTWRSIDEHPSDVVRFFTALIVLFLLIGGINQWNELRAQGRQILKVQNQQAQILKQLQKTQVAIEQNTAAQFATESSYIQCIATFFGQTDRSNETLTDLNNCEIKNETNGSSVGLSSGVSAPSSASTAPTSVSTNSAQGSAPPSTNNAPAPTQTTAPSTPAPAAPITVLGVQVCIPFTNVCIVR